jgi:hypothetical protein
MDEALRRSCGGILVWASDMWTKYELRRFVEAEEQDKCFHFTQVLLEEIDLPIFASGRNFYREDPEGPSDRLLLSVMYLLSGKTMPIETIKFIAQTGDAVQDQLNQIGGARSIGDRDRLKELAAGDSLIWLRSPLIFSKATQALIELGCYAEALEILSRADRYFSNSLRLNQLRAVSLAGMGQVLEAQRVVGAVHAAGHRDRDTLVILARIWMNRYRSAYPVDADTHQG